MRTEVKNAIDAMYVCAARALTGETLPHWIAKKLFPKTKKKIHVIVPACNSDYSLIGEPAKIFSYADEICLSLHEKSVPWAEEDLQKALVEKKEWVDKIHRYSSPLGYTDAIKQAVIYAKRTSSPDVLSIIADADTGRVLSANGDTLKKAPSMALLRADGTIPGKLIERPNYNGKGRKRVFRKSNDEQIQITPTAKEFKEVLLALANIGVRLGYGMMILPNKNNWEDYAKGTSTFQQGLNGGGIRFFLDSKAFDAYLELDSSVQEEDYKTNVFLAKNFGGRTAFVPRFVSLSYVVLWASTSITRNKTGALYRRYLEASVIQPLCAKGIRAYLVEGKGNKAASVPRLSRDAARLVVT